MASKAILSSLRRLFNVDKYVLMCATEMQAALNIARAKPHAVAAGELPGNRGFSILCGTLK